MTAPVIERWSVSDYRIKFQGASSAYWHYSRPYSTRHEAECAVRSIKRSAD